MNVAQGKAASAATLGYRGQIFSERAEHATARLSAASRLRGWFWGTVPRHKCRGNSGELS